MKILLLDNYDSFTYNLAHLVEAVCGVSPVIRKNDALNLDEVASYDKILLSPGPGLPSEAGVMPELLSRYMRSKPILGVCLGLQAIAESLGGSLSNLREVFHGVAAPMDVCVSDFLFKGCPARFNVGRYHSWVVNEQTLPADLIVTARDRSGMIMAVRHRSLSVHGVQFHPESVLTEYGATVMRNWLAA